LSGAQAPYMPSLEAPVMRDTALKAARNVRVSTLHSGLALDDGAAMPEPLPA